MIFELWILDISPRPLRSPGPFVSNSKCKFLPSSREYCQRWHRHYHQECPTHSKCRQSLASAVSSLAKQRFRYSVDLPKLLCEHIPTLMSLIFISLKQYTHSESILLSTQVNWIWSRSTCSQAPLLSDLLQVLVRDHVSQIYRVGSRTLLVGISQW